MTPSPKPPNELIELQEWFSAAVTAIDNESYLEQSSRFITPSSRQDTSERLNIYTHDFWPRIIDALADDFPILAKILGDSQFEYWVRQYIKQFPSKSFTLYYLGTHLETFLKDHYDHNNKDLVTTVARYEWAKCSAFFSENKPPYKPLNTDPSALSQVRLTLHPSVQLCHLNYHPSMFTVENKTPHPTSFVIFRQNFSILEEEINENFMTLLHYIKKGGTLSEIISRLAENENEATVQECGHHIQTYFAHMLQSDWLVTV